MSNHNKNSGGKRATRGEKLRESYLRGKQKDSSRKIKPICRGHQDEHPTKYTKKAW
jgi:hypothetical protein